MDAILFSANPSMVDMGDAQGHLKSHKELYWSVGFQINKDNFSFPIWGFIHISGEYVKYRALVSDILPFSPAHYEDAAFALVKTNQWREDWKNNSEARTYPWKNVLVMTDIDRFEFDTNKFEKYGGGLITQPPQGYARVIPPNEPPSLSPALPSPVSIYEKNLEDFVVQQLDAIETGLHLVKRQFSTLAGRMDLLCQDAHGEYVVVELKKGEGSYQVVGQTLKYMGWLKETYPNKGVRGIIIVGKIDEELRYALKAAPDIKAKEFKLSIQ